MKEEPGMFEIKCHLCTSSGRAKAMFWVVLDKISCFTINVLNN